MVPSKRSMKRDLPRSSELLRMNVSIQKRINLAIKNFMNRVSEKNTESKDERPKYLTKFFIFIFLNIEASLNQSKNHITYFYYLLLNEDNKLFS
jgi:hypothetical protein